MENLVISGRPETLYTLSGIRDYIALMKPRVILLVVFTGITGMCIAPAHVHPLLQLVALICMTCGSGAANAINMWYDTDIDIIMERTKNRPTVTGKIASEDALSFGIILGVVSVTIMGACVNLISAALLLAAILFYVFIYTIWLKRTSSQNIVIGGAAGAFPPMIGWASMTGSISLESAILFLLIFMWTPPHFWALSLYRADDYSKANIPMLPVVRGEEHTKKQILFYTVLMVLVSLLPFYLNMGGIFYLISALILGGYFLYYAIALFRAYNNKFAPRLFGFSIIYLFTIFTCIIIDSIIMRYQHAIFS